jgi:hypothetical protein
MLSWREEAGATAKKFVIRLRDGRTAAIDYRLPTAQQKYKKKMWDKKRLRAVCFGGDQERIFTFPPPVLLLFPWRSMNNVKPAATVLILSPRVSSTYDYSVLMVVHFPITAVYSK